MSESTDQKPHFDSYSEAVEWIYGLIPSGMKPGLKRMQHLMEKLKHPERKLKFIHVGGTNGKGSTCAYLNQVLLQCGYDVGCFTSPYIEKFTDRIQYNGSGISEEQITAVCNILYPIAEEMRASEYGVPSMFEVVTALAIYYYANVVFPDFVVLEVGLGGRLDSTNVVRPILSVITNIGFDHTELLGDTADKIAAEKAGIIKSGTAVVSAVEQPEAVDVIRRTAQKNQSTLYLLGEQYNCEPVHSELDRQVFHLRTPFREWNHVAVSLNGEHQQKNAAVALMALDVLKQYYAVVMDDEDVYQGMLQTKWPGRLEMVHSHPRVLVDGAHNAEGAAALVQAIQTLYPHRKLRLMMGMISTKNHTSYFKHILPIVDTIILTEPDFHKKTDAVKLAEKLAAVKQELNSEADIRVEKDWRKALDLLLDLTEEEDLAVATGTLYLISDVRSWLLHQHDSEKGW